MKVPFVDLNAQYQSIKKEIDGAIFDVINKAQFIRGPYVDKFEKEFASAMKVKHCISCANGTDALYISMHCLGVKSGDEVITTAHSWISTSETITQTGAKVIFCDTKDDTFNINPSLIESKINSKTKGIIAVHLYGQPADMDAIQAIASKHNLWVIEDSAQAHFATYKGKNVGTIGKLGTFSFYPGKNLGAMGDAGCIVTNDDELAELMKLYARHGGKGDHTIEGINSRMDGIQAAILSVKLPHLKNWIKERQRVARRYTELLKEVGDLILPEVGSNRDHVWHLYVIRTHHRDNLRTYLKEADIATVLNYPIALPFLKAYNYLNHNPSDFPVAYANQGRILSLPIFPELKDEQIVYVTDKIKEYFSINQHSL